MIVIKFGGTSVGDASRVATAIEIVAGRAERRPIVVVSALSGVTNELVAATRLAASGDFDAVDEKVTRIRERHAEVAQRLVRQKSDYLDSFLAQLRKHTDQISAILKGISLVGEVSPRANDKIVAIGEKLSSVLFAYSMRLRTLPGVHVDSEIVVVTDERFGDAAPDMDETRKRVREILLPEIERRHIPVMGGFIGRSISGATTTLGRGGSDYSASVLGAAIGAEEIQIWTDVDGMMTCDPRLIPTARIISEISYDEAAELAYFGAKVLHPKTIEPAVDARIPIRVLNTHNLESAGTRITREGGRTAGPIAIALKKGITVIHITSNQMLGAHGFLARIFEIFDRFEVPVDLITTSEVSVSLTIDERDNLELLLAALKPVAEVRVEDGQAIVALVGRRVMHDVGIGARMFTALEGRHLSMMTMGSSDLNVSIVLPEAEADDAVRSLHAALFETSPAEAR
jgi:aspartate kinase